MPKFDARIMDKEERMDTAIYNLDGDRLTNVIVANTDECYVERTSKHPGTDRYIMDRGEFVLERTYMDFDVKNKLTGELLFEAWLNKKDVK